MNIRTISSILCKLYNWIFVAKALNNIKALYENLSNVKNLPTYVLKCTSDKSALFSFYERVEVLFKRSTFTLLTLSSLALFLFPTWFASNSQERRDHLVCNFRANVKLYAWVSVHCFCWFGWLVDPSSRCFHQAWVASIAPTVVIIPSYGLPCLHRRRGFHVAWHFTKIVTKM